MKNLNYLKVLDLIAPLFLGVQPRAVTAIDLSAQDKHPETVV